MQTLDCDRTSRISNMGLHRPKDLSLGPDDPELVALHERIEALEVLNVQQSEEKDAYMDALLLLRRAFAIPYQRGDALGVKFAMFLWVEGVSQKYIELMSELRPLALVILVYMCVMLKDCDHYWYITGSSQRITRELCSSNVPGDEWLPPWIDWPRQRVLGE
jgi:hypothetical protein